MARETVRSTPTGSSAVAAAVLAFAAAAPAAAQVEVRKLSDGGEAHSAAFAGGGDLAIYDRKAADADEVYSVPIEGGPSTPLNQPQPGNAAFWEVSPDGEWVVMSTDDETLFTSEVYSIPAEGGMRTKLNPPLGPHGDATHATANPDSTLVVYRMRVEIDQPEEVYRVPIEGGESTRLSGPMAGDRSVIDFRISPDGQWVVYLADEDIHQVYELYSVPIGGGTPVKLNAPLSPGRTLFNVTVPPISPDSSRVIYVADQDTDDVYELYSVPIGGGMPVKLSGPLGPGRGVAGTSPRISPDSSRVTYVADQDADDVYELYSVPIGGGAPVKLNRPLVAGGDVHSGQPEHSHVHSPDSTRVVYLADGDADEVYELYSVPIGGGTAVKLNPTPTPGGDVGPFAFVNIFTVTPDSSRVLYLADQETDDQRELWSVPLAGGTSVRVNDPLIAGGGVFEFRLTDAGDRAFYVADQETDEMFELWAAPVGGGGGSTRYNEPLVALGDIFEFVLREDGYSVLYLGDQEEENKSELYFATQLVFADGFESGDTAAWTTSAP